MTNKELLDEVIKLSPVPIIFVGKIGCGCKGIYQHSKLYGKRIKVMKNLRLQEKIGVLLHEIGHVRYELDNINGDKKVAWISEYYADMFVLRWLLENKQKKVLKCWMQAIKNYIIGINFSAGLRIIASDLWAECDRYVDYSYTNVWFGYDEWLGRKCLEVMRYLIARRKRKLV